MADQVMADGNISHGRPMEHVIRQLGRFTDMKLLTVADISGDELVIETDYAGYDLVQVFNDTAASGDVAFKTKGSGSADATAVVVPVDSHQCCAFVLPPIYSIVKATTTLATIILLFQKR